MTSQKCYDCALKHCAAALSYAKEIIGGHAEGNPLDHRIDLLGELCNLEHHLELLDGGLLREAQLLRRGLQGRGMDADEGDIARMREMYAGIEERARIPNPAPEAPRPSVARSRGRYVVVVDSPDDGERFLLAHECLRRNVMNEIEIVALNPSVDVPADVKAIRQPLRGFVESLTDECFVYMTQDNFVIARCDLNLLPDIHLHTRARNAEKYGGSAYPYEWDCGAPHVLFRDRFLKHCGDGGDVLNDYYIGSGAPAAYDALSYVVRARERLCCASRSNAEGGYVYATALDDGAFRDLRKWLEERWASVDAGAK